jgi:hypothetical protein
MRERTKRIVKWLIVSIGIISTCLVAFVCWIGWLFGPRMCGHEVPQVTLSLDGKHQALVFEGDCGAADHFHTFVSILPKRKNLGEHELGNVFGVDGNQTINVQWNDASHLVVDFPQPAESKIHFRKNLLNRVYIEYVGVR